jgi:hypothetical protein
MRLWVSPVPICEPSMSNYESVSNRVAGSYPGGPTRGKKGGGSYFRGVREREGARSRMLRHPAIVERRLRYVLAAVVGIAVALTAVTSISRVMEADPHPQVADRSFEGVLKSERKQILGELWKMEALEAMR